MLRLSEDIFNSLIETINTTRLIASRQILNQDYMRKVSECQLAVFGSECEESNLRTIINCDQPTTIIPFSNPYERTAW